MNDWYRQSPVLRSGQVPWIESKSDLKIENCTFHNVDKGKAIEFTNVPKEDKEEGV